MPRVLRNHPLTVLSRLFMWLGHDQCHGQRQRVGWLKAWVCAFVLLVLSGGLAVAQDNETSSSLYNYHTGPAPIGAVIAGNSWRCRDGYALGGSGQCDPVVAPPNGIVVANGWRCMAGFAQDDEACVRLVPPSYGYVRNNRILCVAGYALKTDGSCQPVIAPANAIVVGDGWRCNAGFHEMARPAPRSRCLPMPLSAATNGTAIPVGSDFVTAVTRLLLLPMQPFGGTVGAAMLGSDKRGQAVLLSRRLTTPWSEVTAGPARQGFAANGMSAFRSSPRPTPPFVAMAGPAMPGSARMATVSARLLRFRPMLRFAAMNGPATQAMSGPRKIAVAR